MRNIVIVIAVLFLFVPVIAQAHLATLEPELYQYWGPLEQRPPQSPSSWPVSWGGSDWTFEYPYVYPVTERSDPYVDISNSRISYNYLHENDVDVVKLVVAEDQPGFPPMWGSAPDSTFLQIAAYPPACCQYKDFYPIAAILGPGLPPIEEELPFELPEDCQDCGMLRTHPTKAGCNERPVLDFGTVSLFYDVDSSTDVVRWQPDPSAPDGGLEAGVYYYVFWEENGIPGEFSMSAGSDEAWSDAEWAISWFSHQVMWNNKSTRVPCDQTPVGPTSPFFGTAVVEINCCDLTITICHKPGTDGEETKDVVCEALEGHLGHGDYIGECGSPKDLDYIDVCPYVYGDYLDGVCKGN
jgi:hypothetical protein